MRSRNQIRIISGVNGGIYIDTPKTDATHPMGERERQAIFNRLREKVAGKRILDAFAGSGALGLECLSLDANTVDFLENNPKAIKTIHTNIKKLKYKEKTQIVKQIDDIGRYDIIFADPPYDNPQYNLVNQLISHLKIGGFFVLSHPLSPEPPAFERLYLLSDKKYAAAHIKIYQKQ